MYVKDKFTSQHFSLDHLNLNCHFHQYSNYISIYIGHSNASTTNQNGQIKEIYH